MKYRVILAYEGTDYAGWQEQPQLRTVQGELSRALAQLDGRPVVAHGAGRTDAGVHAEGQVVSFILQRAWHEPTLVRAINANLPRDIRVLEAERAPEDFHARFNSVRKTYRYQIVLGPVISPFHRRYAMHYPYAIDRARFEQDAAQLLGRHDFRAFTVSANETRTTVRTIEKVELEWQSNRLMVFFTGDGFVRYQVRTMVGALLDINRDRHGHYASQGIESMAGLLDRADRRVIGLAAPAHGLTLMKVEY